MSRGPIRKSALVPNSHQPWPLNCKSSSGDSTARPVPVQEHEGDIVGVLVAAGMPAKLQNNEHRLAVSLALGPRMAEATLQQHGMLRVVLPSAAQGCTLPQPAWLAGLHAKLSAAQRMHIVCCSRTYFEHLDSNTKTPVCGPRTKHDEQYLAAYTSALRSALSVKGNTGLPATSLHVQVKGAPSPEGACWYTAASHTGLVASLPELTSLLPQLQSAHIQSAWALDEAHACKLVKALEACPILDAVHLSTGHIFYGDFSDLLQAALHLPQLHVLIWGGTLGLESVRTIQEHKSATLQVLGCKQMFLGKDHTGLQLMRIHTLTAPPTSNVGSWDSCNSSKVQPGIGNWQPSAPACSIGLSDVLAFPAVRFMQQVEIGLRHLPDEPSQGQELLVSLLEGQLASCAQGWALSIDVDLRIRGPEAAAWSGALPPGGLPVVQNLVLRLTMETPEPGQLPAWTEADLRTLYSALPGLQQVLIEPRTGSTYTAGLDLYLPCMSHAASLAVQQQLAWHAQHMRGGKGASAGSGSGAGAATVPGTGACLRALYLAADCHRAQGKPMSLVTANCSEATSALHRLAAQCAILRDGSAEEAEGMAQAGLHPALQVHVAGVEAEVLNECNMQLAAAGVLHHMLMW